MQSVRRDTRSDGTLRRPTSTCPSGKQPCGLPDGHPVPGGKEPTAPEAGQFFGSWALMNWTTLSRYSFGMYGAAMAVRCDFPGSTTFVKCRSSRHRRCVFALGRRSPGQELARDYPAPSGRIKTRRAPTAAALTFPSGAVPAAASARARPGVPRVPSQGGPGRALPARPAAWPRALRVMDTLKSQLTRHVPLSTGPSPLRPPRGIILYVTRAYPRVEW